MALTMDSTMRSVLLPAAPRARAAGRSSTRRMGGLGRGGMAASETASVYTLLRTKTGLG